VEIFSILEFRPEKSAGIMGARAQEFDKERKIILEGREAKKERKKRTGKAAHILMRIRGHAQEDTTKEEGLLPPATKGNVARNFGTLKRSPILREEREKRAITFIKAVNRQKREKNPLSFRRGHAAKEKEGVF